MRLIEKENVSKSLVNKLNEAEDKETLNKELDDYKITSLKKYTSNYFGKYAIGTLKNGNTFYLGYDEGDVVIFNLKPEEIVNFFINNPNGTIEDFMNLDYGAVLDDLTYENSDVGEFIAHQVWPKHFKIQEDEPDPYPRLDYDEFQDKLSKNCPQTISDTHWISIEKDSHGKPKFLEINTRRVFSLKDFKTFRDFVMPYINKGYFDAVYATSGPFYKRLGTIWAMIWSDGSIDYSEYADEVKKLKLNSKESYKNLYDYLVAINNTDWINDETYGIDIQCEIKDSNGIYGKFITELFKRVEYKGNGIADFTSVFKNKIDKLVEIFNFESSDRDSQLEEFICKILPEIVKGFDSDQVFRKMYDLLVN